MTINELANKIAADFRDEIEEMECEDFADLVRRNDWEPRDIREEIEWLATDYIDKEYEDLKKTYGGFHNIPTDILLGKACIYDDCSVSDKETELSYRQFKKLIISLI